jgi:hypothetical protein
MEGAGMTTFGQCDCCESYAMLAECWPHGIETYACRACQGQYEDVLDEVADALNEEDDASFCGAPDDETAAILQHPVVAL